MPTALTPFRTELERLLPLRSARIQLALANTGTTSPINVDDDGALTVDFLLTVYSAAENEQIDDCKEQEVYLGKFAEHPPERWLAYIEGTIRSSSIIVEQLRSDPTRILPIDLFCYWEVLEDTTLSSSDDFARALSDRSRLDALNNRRREGAWIESLTPCGLGEQVAAVRTFVRPALRLELELSEDQERSVGESRVGGDPDLPPAMEWPMANGQPLVFVAQIELRKIASTEAARELPRDGLLSFFYDPMGDAGSLSHSVRVLHLADVSTLANREAPEGVARLRAHSLRWNEEKHLPAIESEFFYHSLLPAEFVQQYYERLAGRNGADPPINPYALGRLLEDMSERSFERPAHQLLGHPMSIQGDPYLDVEVSTQPNGWDDWKEGTLSAYETRMRALGWRLLLQVDAVQDGELLLNQDGGFFYFWIRDEAFAAHDWTQVRGSLQCH